MLSNKKLNKAIVAKKDEFYTQLKDIESEIQAYIEHNPLIFKNKIVYCPCDDYSWSNFAAYFEANFEKLGLQKLITTCFVDGGNGKYMVLTNHGKETGLLDGTGDYRSLEATHYRNKADFIITNPPFSKFRDFMAWVFESNAQFLVIGNKNCVTFKEIFPRIKNNEMWSGFRPWSGGMWFETMDEQDVDRIENGKSMKNVSAIWLTNIPHGRRYEFIKLNTSKDNLTNYPKLKIQNTYARYDNYDAIEVPRTSAIPADFDGVMGVPISFLDKYSPEQFIIVGATESEGKGFSNGLWFSSSGIAQACVNKQRVYKRIFIKLKEVV